jgi:hypothetical protein
MFLLSLAYCADLDDREAIEGLISLKESHTAIYPRAPIKRTLKRIDPIKQLKAQHCLKYHRSLLATFLAFNITLEELKSRFARSLDSLLLMKSFQKRLEYLKIDAKIPDTKRIVPFPSRTKNKRMVCQRSIDILSAR